MVLTSGTRWQVGAGKAWVEGSGLRGWEEMRGWQIGIEKRTLRKTSLFRLLQENKIALGIVPFTYICIGLFKQKEGIPVNIFVLSSSQGT